MRNALLAAALAVIPSCASAQEAPARFYGEAGVGIALYQDIETEDFVFDQGAGVLAGTITLDPSAEVTFGGELGLATGRWRFGVGYDWANVSIDSATFSGTFDGSPLNWTLTSYDLASLGLGTDADTSVQSVTGNAYYSFALMGSSIEPYIGMGVGAAIIENASTELTLSASAGARVAISSNAYLGARYRFVHIAGPEVDGFELQPINAHIFSVQIGIYLGSM